MKVAQYASRAEQFTEALRREEYLHFSGIKSDYRTQEIFEQFADLFSREAVVARLEEREGRDGRYLAEFAVRHYIEQRLQGLTERIVEAERAAHVACDGERIPFLRALGQLVQEPDHRRRRALEEAVAEAMSDHNEWRAQRIAGQRKIAQELGFEDYRRLCEDLSGQPLRTLGKEMALFVKDTQSTYRERIEEALDGAGIVPPEATDWDLRWTILAPRHTSVFPRERLVPAAEATLSGMGIVLSEQANVQLDLEDRPGKSPRPFCAPISVPGEVWVVASPRGGWVDFLSFFHELGHAEHFACTDRKLPGPYRIMGDEALTEAFAFLVQSVVLDRGWLREVLDVKSPPPCLFRAGQLVNLWYVRRYAGKILYELDLHGRDIEPAEMAPHYARLLGEAVRVRVAPEAYLFDVDDWFYCARYLRAWMLDACLQLYLREHFGPVWFQSPEAGQWLRSLWRRGAELRAEELAAELGLQFGMAPLRDRLLGDP